MKHRIVSFTTLIVFLSLLSSAFALEDPLPSWRESKNKARIIEFLAKIVNPLSPDFMQPADRIAVFDFDGTLIAERPIHVHRAFLDDSAKQHESQKVSEPLFIALGRLLGIGGTRDAYGMPENEYYDIARAWARSAVNNHFQRPWSACVYRPMIELIHWLKEKDFQLYLCSGSDRTLLRVFSESSFGIPVEHVMGSDVAYKFELRGKGVSLIRLEPLKDQNVGEFKAMNIQRQIGKPPLMAFGNSDGDIQMLEFSRSRPGISLQALVVHDDMEREVQYDDGAKTAHSLAIDRQWLKISMKNNWIQVFP